MTQPPASAPNFLSSIDLDRLRPKLHRYCARMVGSALDGEDIVQDALLRALESALPERSIENPGPGCSASPTTWRSICCDVAHALATHKARTTWT
jgi:hypothetical protein